MYQILKILYRTQDCSTTFVLNPSL